MYKVNSSSPLLQARQQTLIDQISSLETQASELRHSIGEAQLGKNSSLFFRNKYRSLFFLHVLLSLKSEDTQLRTQSMTRLKDIEIAARNETIEAIKWQMRRQALEFDDMMTGILTKLSKEILVSTAPKQLLNAGVPILDQLAQVNEETQSRALAGR